ncbi:MHYT domain-containing protein [Plasmodiophora brassicae]
MAVEVNGETLIKQWNYWLILLSYALSVFGSFTAFLMVEQAKISLYKRKNPLFWVVWAAVALGGCGIFAMHFIGMTALSLVSPDGKPFPFTFSPGHVVISVVAPIVLEVLALLIVMRGYHHRHIARGEAAPSPAQQLTTGYTGARPLTLPSLIRGAMPRYTGVRRTMMHAMKDLKRMELPKKLYKETDWYLLGAALMSGTGVGVMHYTGLMAVTFQGHIQFDPWVVSASMLIAIIASAAAFLLLFVIQMPMLQIVSAAVMGIAVCGAHYTGMQHVFVYDAAASAPAADALNKDSVGLIVAWAGIITCFLLEAFGASQLKSAKLHLDRVVAQTQNELTQTIVELVETRRDLDTAKRMLTMINVLRPLHSSDKKKTTSSTFATCALKSMGLSYADDKVPSAGVGDASESLHKVLAHPVAVELLKDQQVQGYRQEGIMFLLAVNLLTSTKPRDQKMTKSLTSKIMQEFIVEGAPHEINISMSQRIRLQERSKKPSVRMFAEAYDEVLRLIIHNDYAGFCDSDQGRFALWLCDNVNFGAHHEEQQPPPVSDTDSISSLEELAGTASHKMDVLGMTM